MNTERYYATKLILGEKEKYLIYVSDNKDRFLTNDEGLIVTFEALNELEEYSMMVGLQLEDEAESVITCIDCLVPDEQATDDILFFWNICTDIAYTVGEQFLGDKRKPIINTVYSKLFAGSDVPTIRGDNPPYFPIWTWRERRVANKVLANGIELVKKYVF